MEAFKVAQNIQHTVTATDRKMIIAKDIISLVEALQKSGVTRNADAVVMAVTEYPLILEAIELGQAHKLFSLIDPGEDSQVMLSQAAHYMDERRIELRMQCGSLAMFRDTRGYKHVEQYLQSI